MERVVIITDWEEAEAKVRKAVIPAAGLELVSYTAKRPRNVANRG